jgi:hypothetical protein
LSPSSSIEGAKEEEEGMKDGVETDGTYDKLVEILPFLLDYLSTCFPRWYFSCTL